MEMTDRLNGPVKVVFNKPARQLLDYHMKALSYGAKTHEDVYSLIENLDPRLEIIADCLDYPTPYVMVGVKKGSVIEEIEAPLPYSGLSIRDMEEESDATIEDDKRDAEMAASNQMATPHRYRDRLHPNPQFIERLLGRLTAKRDSGEMGDYTDIERSESRRSTGITGSGKEVRRVEIKFTDATKNYLRSVGIDPKKIRMLVPLDDVEDSVAENLRSVQSPVDFEVVNIVESSDRKWDVRYKVKAVKG